MDVKSELYEYSRLLIEIRCIQDLLYQNRSMAKYLKGNKLTAASLENYLSNYIESLDAHYQSITEVIENLENPYYNAILKMRYSDSMTWEQIAEKMGFTFQWVHELHRRALKEFEERWICNEPKH